MGLPEIGFDRRLAILVVEGGWRNLFGHSVSRYHGAVPSLVERVGGFISRHSLLKPGDRVGIAVSGGADSVALLRLLLELRGELGLVLSVVHVNHRLREDAAADAGFVAELARAHALELHAHSADVADYATQKKLGIEAAGRAVRYKFFSELLRDGNVDRIATGHTLDDQAETVLLRLVRGAGTRGLAGIYTQFSVPGSQFSVVRPLLGTRRQELVEYLQAFGQDWREDGSNRDLRFARNRIRHGVLPRLEKGLNPAVREALAETAEIARDEEDFWDARVEEIWPEVWKGHGLRLKAFASLHPALQRRVVRRAAETAGLRLSFRHVEEVLDVAAGRSRAAALPKGWTASRSRAEIGFSSPREKRPLNYEYVLSVPGRVAAPEAGVCFEACLLPGGAQAGYNRGGNLFDAASLAEGLVVRNWRAGDRYWPPHTRAAKKVKELLQEHHVTGAERKSWPVVVSGKTIIWLRGFSPPAAVQPRPGKDVVAIRELEL